MDKRPLKQDELNEKVGNTLDEVKASPRNARNKLSKNDQRMISDVMRNNYVGMVTHTIVVTIMELFIFLQAISGAVSVAYFLFTMVLGFFSPIGEIIFYLKDRETPMVKHFLGYGYAVYYTYILFTAENNMVFLFVVPLLLVISIYNDLAYSIKINTGTVLESIIVCVLGARTGKFGYAGIDSAIIQNCIMILIAIFSVLAAKTININLGVKIEKISDLVAKTEDSINSIYGDIASLNQATEGTKDAMEEVSSGTNDTAQAVQNQLVQTQVIEEQTNEVLRAAQEMAEGLQETVAYVELGSKDLRALLEQVEKSVGVSNDAVEKLRELTNKTADMNDILKIIDNITFQTNILALNANVEAAHAGVAGAGFAVVASQVSQMSLKTKEATEKIVDIIANVQASLNEVTESIEDMWNITGLERQKAQETEGSFTQIQNNAREMEEKIQGLLADVTTLSGSNQGIVESIQTISAVSEEVSALASSAMESEENNASILEEIQMKMQNLVEQTSL